MTLKEKYHICNFLSAASSHQSNYTSAQKQLIDVDVNGKTSSRTYTKALNAFCGGMMTPRENTLRGGKLNRHKKGTSSCRDAKETCRLCTQAARKHKGRECRECICNSQQHGRKQMNPHNGPPSAQPRSNVLRQWHMAARSIETRGGIVHDN